MNKYIVPVITLLVGLGLGYLVFHNGATNSEEMVGGNVRTIASNFVNGFYAGSTDQFSVDASGNASTTGTLKFVSETNYGTSTVQKLASLTIGSSSSSPAALGSATAGFFTATTTTQSASTTAVTANSTILITSASTSPFSTLNVNCNVLAPSTTMVTTLVPGNGFIVKTLPAPSGTVTPYCLQYLIVN